MTDTIDLGDGETAEFRTALTGGDQEWYLILRDKLMEENGTAKPAVTGPDPANSAVMKTTPAVPAYLRVQDNIALIDAILGLLLESWTLPDALPWTHAMRKTMDLEIQETLDTAALAAGKRFTGSGPKQRKYSDTSEGTSATSATAPRPEPAPQPSGTASTLSGRNSTPPRRTTTPQK
jgi:hypothetical protein